MLLINDHHHHHLCLLAARSPVRPEGEFWERTLRHSEAEQSAWRRNFWQANAAAKWPARIACARATALLVRSFVHFRSGVTNSMNFLEIFALRFSLSHAAAAPPRLRFCLSLLRPLCSRRRLATSARLKCGACLRPATGVLLALSSSEQSERTFIARSHRAAKYKIGPLSARGRMSSGEANEQSSGRLVESSK